jgi:hypothetical protein
LKAFWVLRKHYEKGLSDFDDQNFDAFSSNNLRTAFRERQGAGSPDAPGGPGDQGCLSRKVVDA